MFLVTFLTPRVCEVIIFVQMKITHITLIAVVGRLIFDAALIGNFLALSHQLVPQDLDVLHGLQQAVSAGRHRPKSIHYKNNIKFQVNESDLTSCFLYSLKHFVGVWVCDLDSAGYIPGHMNYGDYGLDLLHFVPLKPL